jgi:hypothetical protein
MLYRLLATLLVYAIRWHDNHVAPYRGLMVDIDTWRNQR